MAGADDGWDDGADDGADIVVDDIVLDSVRSIGAIAADTVIVCREPPRLSCVGLSHPSTPKDTKPREDVGASLRRERSPPTGPTSVAEGSAVGPPLPPPLLLCPPPLAAACTTDLLVEMLLRPRRESDSGPRTTSGCFLHQQGNRTQDQCLDGVGRRGGAATTAATPPRVRTAGTRNAIVHSSEY